MEALVVLFKKYRENKVARNSFYSVIQLILPTLLLLGMTPVFIHRMGAESYGLWMLATSALGFMSIAEFGLNTAISKYVAEYVGTRDSNSLSAVVTVGLVAYILLGFGLIVPLYVYSPKLAGIFKPSETLSTEQISSVIRIISLGFIPLLFRSGAMAIPVGLQRFEVPVLVTIGYQTLSYTVALLVILLGGSVMLVVSSSVVVLWFIALLGSFVAWRMLNPFNFKLTFPKSRNIINKLFSFAFMSGISGLGSRIFSFADRLAVGAVLGLEGVAYYTVIISVATKILQLSGAITSALMPAVSTWMASGLIQRVRTYFLRTTAALMALNFLLGGTLLLISKPLLNLWMGEVFSNQALLPFRILTVIYAFISINAPAYYVAFGIGKPEINALAGVVGGCLTIGLIFLWGKSLGLLGIAIANSGYLVTWAIIGYIYLWLSRNMKQTSTVA